MENIPNSKLQMRTLMLCNDVAFLGITRSVLIQLHVTPRMVNRSAAAVAMIQAREFEVAVVDWREIDKLQEFLSALRHSKLNQKCVLVSIVRDLLDLKRAFAAGVHFLSTSRPRRSRSNPACRLPAARSWRCGGNTIVSRS